MTLKAGALDRVGDQPPTRGQLNPSYPDASASGGSPLAGQQSSTAPTTQGQRTDSAKATAGRGTESSTRSSTCSHYGEFVRSTTDSGSSTKFGLSPMERFLSEGPDEQYALFVRPDTGELSTSKSAVQQRAVKM